MRSVNGFELLGRRREVALELGCVFCCLLVLDVGSKTLPEPGRKCILEQCSTVRLACINLMLLLRLLFRLLVNVTIESHESKEAFNEDCGCPLPIEGCSRVNAVFRELGLHEVRRFDRMHEQHKGKNIRLDSPAESREARTENPFDYRTLLKPPSLAEIDERRRDGRERERPQSTGWQKIVDRDV